MKIFLKIFFCFSVIVSIFACSDDEAKLTNKWQLRWYSYDDGTRVDVGNVFYNFQKGSFSAICLHSDGEYYTFFGLYTLKDNKLSVSIEEFENFEDPLYASCLGWEDGKRTFTIESLESSQLILRYNEVLLTFRKY